MDIRRFITDEDEFTLKLKDRTIRFYNELVDEISLFSLDTITINPYIISIIFQTPRAIVTYFFYQSITRKISGKMGIYIEDLLSYLSDGRSELAEFDLKKQEENLVHHIEIKTTTNTMRLAEMKKFFMNVIPSYQMEKPNQAFKLGTSFGEINHPKHSKSITNYIEKMLNEHQDNIRFNDIDNIHICGRQLWDFLSGEENFLENAVIPRILESLGNIPRSKSILEVINDKIDSLTEDFMSRYGKDVTLEMIMNNFI